MDPRFGEPPALRRSDWDTSRAQRLHQSQAGRAAQRLTEIAQAAEPGTRLGSKDELRAQCGVSVGTFNEAVRLVQARGVVWIRPGPGGGLFAATQSPMTRLGNSVLAMDTAGAAGAAVAEAIRIRAALEPLLLEDALWHASPADVAALHEYLAEMEPAVDAGDRVAFAAAQWRLHHYLASLTPNPMLRSLCTNLFDLIEAEAPSNSDLAETYRSHRALVDAIDARDRARAMRLISELAGERAARPD